MENQKQPHIFKEYKIHKLVHAVDPCSSCSVGERTEHANTIDHEITLNLLKHVGADDASPIVRRELVVALGVVVKVFEANFVAVCRIALEEEGGEGRRSGSAGPQGCHLT